MLRSLDMILEKKWVAIGNSLFGLSGLSAIPMRTVLKNEEHQTTPPI
ncbi:hypothetical protein [Maribacter sp. 2307UL18-2]